MQMLRFFTGLILFIAGCMVFSQLFAAPQIPATTSTDTDDTSNILLTSRSFGLNGPFEIGGFYNDKLGFMVNTKYSDQIAKFNALLLELGIGSYQYRLGATWGYQVTPIQRIKITGEHLAQKIDYAFFSGTEQLWSQQNAIGISYQFLIHNPWLKAISLSSYYAKANSKHLSSLIFQDNTQLNLRYISGAVSSGAGFSLEIAPWTNAILGTEFYYDDVLYSNFYQPNSHTFGLGTKISLKQTLNNYLKFELAESSRAIYHQYQAGISWIAHNNVNNLLEFGVYINHTQSDAAIGRNDWISLTVNYYWDISSKAYSHGYSAPNFGQLNLVSWTSEPAVHMEQVLTKVDQKVENVVGGSSSSTPMTCNNTSDIVLTFHSGETVSIETKEYFYATNTNQPITITTSNLPLGLTFDQKTGMIIGKIPYNSAGDYVIILTATTNGGSFCKRQLHLQIIDQSVTPKIGYLTCPAKGDIRVSNDGVQNYAFNSNSQHQGAAGDWWQSDLYVNGTQSTLICYYRFRLDDTQLVTTIVAPQVRYANGSSNVRCTQGRDNCKVKIVYP